MQSDSVKNVSLTGLMGIGRQVDNVNAKAVGNRANGGEFTERLRRLAEEEAVAELARNVAGAAAPVAAAETAAPATVIESKQNEEAAVKQEQDAGDAVDIEELMRLARLAAYAENGETGADGGIDSVEAGTATREGKLRLGNELISYALKQIAAILGLPDEEGGEPAGFQFDAANIEQLAAIMAYLDLTIKMANDRIDVSATAESANIAMAAYGMESPIADIAPEENPAELSDFAAALRTEKFRLDMAFNLIGVSGMIAEKMAEKSDAGTAAGIPQAVNPADLGMSVADTVSAFSNLIKEELAASSDRVRRIVRGQAEMTGLERAAIELGTVKSEILKAALNKANPAASANDKFAGVNLVANAKTGGDAKAVAETAVSPGTADAKAEVKVNASSGINAADVKNEADAAVNKNTDNDAGTAVPVARGGKVNANFGADVDVNTDTAKGTADHPVFRAVRQPGRSEGAANAGENVKTNAMRGIRAASVDTAVKEASVEAGTAEIKTEVKADVNTAEVKTKVKADVNTPNVKTEAKADANTPNVRTEVRAGVDTPNVKTETKAGVNTADVKTEAKANVNMPEVKAEAKAGVNAPDVKTEAKAGVNAPDVKTEAKADVNAPGVKAEAGVNTADVKTEAKANANTVSVKPDVNTEVGTEAKAEAYSANVKADVDRGINGGIDKDAGAASTVSAAPDVNSGINKGAKADAGVAVPAARDVGMNAEAGAETKVDDGINTDKGVDVENKAPERAAYGRRAAETADVPISAHESAGRRRLSNVESANRQASKSAERAMGSKLSPAGEGAEVPVSVMMSARGKRAAGAADGAAGSKEHVSPKAQARHKAQIQAPAKNAVADGEAAELPVSVMESSERKQVLKKTGVSGAKAAAKEAAKAVAAAIEGAKNGAVPSAANASDNEVLAAELKRGVELSGFIKNIGAKAKASGDPVAKSAPAADKGAAPVSGAASANSAINGAGNETDMDIDMSADDGATDGGTGSADALGTRAAEAKHAERSEAATLSQNERLEVIRQISEKLGNAVRSGANEIRLTLRPEALGEVRMSLRVQGDVVFAKMQVENKQVKALVESNMQSLKDSLNRQNLEFGAIDVEVGADSDGGRPTREIWQEMAERSESRGGFRDGVGADIAAASSDGFVDTPLGSETGRRFGDNTFEYFA